MAPPALPGFHATTSLSATPQRLGLSLTGVRLAVHSRRHRGLPVVAAVSCGTCRRQSPRWNREDHRLLSRLPRQRPSPCTRRVGFHVVPFRGLLDVHSRYGLHLRGAAISRPFPSKASKASLPPLSLRLLPVEAISYRGRTLTHLKTTTFPQHTCTTVQNLHIHTQLAQALPFRHDSAESEPTNSRALTCPFAQPHH